MKPITVYKTGDVMLSGKPRISRLLLGLTQYYPKPRGTNYRYILEGNISGHLQSKNLCILKYLPFLYHSGLSIFLTASSFRGLLIFFPSCYCSGVFHPSSVFIFTLLSLRFNYIFSTQFNEKG